MKELIIGNITAGELPENMVTVNTNQTITGSKTFEGMQNFNRISAHEIDGTTIRDNNHRVYSRAHEPNNLFVDRRLINPGTDFNNLTANGVYTYAQGNWPGNVHPNRPINPAHGYGVLLVNESHLFISQQLFYVSGQIDTRFRNDNGPWSAWRRIQHSDGSGSGGGEIPFNMVTTDTNQTISGSKIFTSEINVRPGNVISDPAVGVSMGFKVHGSGIGVNGNSRFNGDVSINGVSQTHGNLIGLGTMNTHTQIFNALDTYHRLLVTGVGSAWGSALTTLLGDPGIGVFATCQARRISFSAENREIRNDRGIIEVIATDPFGDRVKKGWLYNVAGQNCWTGWRNV